MEHKRKCIGCGEMKDRTQMIKITKTNDGNVVIMPNSKIFGRSAYLCYNKNCIDNALKKDKLKRLLKYTSNANLKGLLDGQFESK